MKKMYEELVNFYPVSKTLRFELKPIGKTFENMKKNCVLEGDEKRARDYKKAKEIMDEYHKKFINDCLEDYKIDVKKLEEYNNILISEDKDKIKKVESELRKEISERFAKNSNYKKIFGKEMIEKLLPEFVNKKEDKEVLDEFSKFTTYFKGFDENRKNIYSSDENSTSIAYRLINENLPIFINNVKCFEYFKKVIPEDVQNNICKDLWKIIKVEKLDDMFKLDYFNEVLTQNGIDMYNQIIGSISRKDNKNLKGINEYINEYKQKHPEDKKIAKFNILYKQILSDSETASFTIDEFENDQQVINSIRDLTIQINSELLNNLENLLNNIEKFDLEKIYLKNDSSIKEISNYLYGDWYAINSHILNWYDEEYGKRKDTQKVSYENARKKYLKAKQNLSIQFLNSCINKEESLNNIQTYFKNYKVIDIEDKKENIFELIINKYEKINSFINSNYPEDKNLKEDFKNILLIKEYLDSVKKLESFIKPLIGARYDLTLEKDNKFYDKLNEFWNNLQIVNLLYDKVRNYLTGKVYSKDKIKLNFKNPTLLDGWCESNEIANSSLLFKNDKGYYLGIINKDYNKDFKNILEPQDENDVFLKMKYIQIADPQKDIQNLLQIEGKTVKKNGKVDKKIGENIILEELKNKYLPQEINNIRKTKSYSTQSEKFKKEDLIKFIDYYKERVKEYYNKFAFEFKDSKEYKDFGEFTAHINEQAYHISFDKVSKKYINDLVDEGKLYLFQIYNKDFSEYSHGKPNLHTLYWKMLFDEENLKNVIYKLNGKAEIFYRKPSIERKITHNKNQKINNKNELNSKKQSIFKYDLIKDKRFTEEKFLFHVPITLNFNNKGINKINEKVRKEIKKNEENYIIGIDRGERNLLYLVLIDSKGRIVKQSSLNKITDSNTNYKTDYHQLLDGKEEARKKARENWQLIENIKELKGGYLSQVISEITNLMIEYNAIVILEDLNGKFKRVRQGIEKQVYQKFEKMLIDKLNYLVKKEKLNNECGGLLKAYQLTNQFESFRKLGKQSGVLFYIPAWNTSKIDPVTGFINLLYVKYENEEKTKKIIEKMDDIKYNKKEDYFEFYVDFKKFKDITIKKTQWKICTNGNRIKTFKNPLKNNEWDDEEIILTEEFKKLLVKYNIDYYKSDLKEEILKISGRDFWENFLNLFRLTLQLRNSKTKTEEDYIISPVQDSNGKFFNSTEKLKGLPEDADANGAYNIARKGLWIVEQIKNTPDDKLNNVRLAISNNEWMDFVQDKRWE